VKALDWPTALLGQAPAADSVQRLTAKRGGGGFRAAFAMMCGIPVESQWRPACRRFRGLSALWARGSAPHGDPGGHGSLGRHAPLRHRRGARCSLRGCKHKEAKIMAASTRKRRSRQRRVPAGALQDDTRAIGDSTEVPVYGRGASGGCSLRFEHFSQA
jgi:hypothetical protein